MITFDTCPAEPTIDDVLGRSQLADRIEVGESDEVWIHVCRSTGKIEITSKHTGAVLVRCPPEDAHELGIITRPQYASAAATLARFPR
jgi:hypothetical protein